MTSLVRDGVSLESHGEFASVRFSGVSYEDRTVPGDLYINLYGSGPLGQARLHEAVKQGAAAVCCEMKPEREPGVPVLLVMEPRLVMARAAALVHDFPSRALQLCGVTGTTGKSTVSAMLTRCLSVAGIPNGCLFSEGQKVGSILHPPTHTTPDAPLLQARLGEMARNGVRHGVIEVSSHGIAHRRLDEVTFHSGLVTNISLDHTDFHPTMDHYVETKARLFDWLPEEGFAAYSADDPLATRVAAGTKAFRIAVGTGADADVRLSGDRIVFGRRLAERAGRTEDVYTPRLQVVGPHERWNAAMAAAIAFAWGLPMPAIRQALDGYPGLPRRNHFLFQGRRFRAVYCLAYNPQSIDTMYDFVANQWRLTGHKVYVGNIRGSRGDVMNHAIATRLAEVVRRLGDGEVVITAADDAAPMGHAVTPMETAAFIRGLEEAGLPFEFHASLHAAIEAGLSRMRRGSTLLLVGSDSMNAGVDLVRQALPRFTTWLERRRNRAMPDDERLQRCLGI